MDIDAVGKGLQDAADVIDGLNPFDHGDKVVVPPAFFVAEVELVFDGTALAVGMDVAVFKCRLLVSKVDAAGARTAVNTYMSRDAKSVKNALEADRSLGGECVDVFVESVTGPRVYSHQALDYLGIEFAVRVTGRGE